MRCSLIYFGRVSLQIRKNGFHSIYIEALAAIARISYCVLNAGEVATLDDIYTE